MNLHDDRISVGKNSYPVLTGKSEFGYYQMEFLTFKYFISTEVLIIFYYFGAVILPVLVWYFSTRLVQKLGIVKVAIDHVKGTIWSSLSTTRKSKLVIFYLVFLVFMELSWRMLFEFLIAYMQMRDALLQSVA